MRVVCFQRSKTAAFEAEKVRKSQIFRNCSNTTLQETSKRSTLRISEGRKVPLKRARASKVDVETVKDNAKVFAKSRKVNRLTTNIKVFL